MKGKEKRKQPKILPRLNPVGEHRRIGMKFFGGKEIAVTNFSQETT